MYVETMFRQSAKHRFALQIGGIIMRYLITLSSIIVITILALVVDVGMAQIDWEKYPANPVIDLGDNGSWDDVHLSHPSVLFDGNMYHLWYAGDNGSSRGIGCAKSDDGVAWEKYPDNPVLSDGIGDTWDGDFVTQPSVLHDGTMFHMWYAGYDGTNMRIGYATSDDGVNWTKNAANPVLDLGESGAWDSTGVSNPFVLHDGTQYCMWYTGYDGTNMRIGYATSDDGVAWSGVLWNKHDNPVLDLGESGSWDSVVISSPTVVLENDVFQMWYAGYDGDNLTIGYATSSDGMAWTKDASNLILDLGEIGSWDSVGVSSPTVILNGNTYRMWHTGYDGKNIRIGLSSLDLPEVVVRLTARVHANPATYEAAENGAEVTLDGSQSIGSDGEPIADDSAYQWDLNNDGDFSDAVGPIVTQVYSLGEHTAALRVTDGNENSIDTVNIKVEDTTSPFVKLLSPHGGEAYQGGETISILWEPAVDIVSLQDNSITLYHSVDVGDWLLITENEGNDGLYEWATPTLNSGDVKIKIEAIDTAGNIGSDTSAMEFTIDSQVPVVELTSPNGGEALAGESIFSVTWELATDNLGLTSIPINLYYSIDGGTNWELIAEEEPNDGEFDWYTPVLDNANMLLRIQAADRAGNVGEYISDNVFEIDSTKPEPPMLTPMGSPTGENTLTIQGTAEALSQVSLFDNGILMVVVPAGGDGSCSFTTPILSDGSHSFTATDTDIAGNVSDASTTVDVLVDTVVPKRPIPLSPADGIILNASPTLVWEPVSDATEVIYRVQVSSDSNFTSPEVDISEIADTQLTPALSDGLWFWQVQAIDALGHESEFSPLSQFSLDTVSPDVPIITSPEAGVIVKETSLTISGTAEPFSHIDISDNEQPLDSVVANAGGSFALVLDGLAEGSHNLSTVATDAAGNKSDASANSFSVDISLPTIALTYPNGNETLRGGNRIDITWDNATDVNLADNPISLFYSLAGLDGWIPIAQNLPNNGSHAWNIPPVNSQSVRMKVVAVDLAGNVGSDTSDNEFTIDSDAPVSLLTLITPDKEQMEYLRGGSVYTILWSLPQDNFSLTDVALGYSSDEGNTWTQIAFVMDTGSIYGSYDWNVPAIDSQEVIIRIEAVDASGNQAEDTSGNHVIDSSSPNAPVLDSLNSPTAQNVLTITGTAEAEGQVNLFDDGNLIAGVQADASGSFSITTGELTDGLYRFTATVADAAGNESATSTLVEVMVDTATPDRPILASPTNGIALNVPPTLVWESVSDITVVTYHVQVDDEPGFASPEVDVSDIVDTQLAPTLSDGIWYWQVQAIDAVGHLSDLSPVFQFTLDTIAPEMPVITSPETGTITNQTSLTISGTAEAESRVDIYDNDQLLGVDMADADEIFALAVQGLTEGKHTLTAKTTDAAGNISDVSASVMLIVDITAPTSPALLSPVDGSITNQNELILEGTAEAESSVTLLDSGVILGTAAANIDGVFSYTTPNLADGNHSFSAIATDAAGNVSEAPTTVDVLVDTVVPKRPIPLSPADGIILNALPTLAWEPVSDATAVTYHVQMDNEPGFDSLEVDVSEIADTQLTPTLSDGVWFWRVQASDAVGHLSDFSPVFQFTLDTIAPEMPIITSPETGTITSDTSLTISGTAEPESDVAIYNNDQLLEGDIADADGIFALAVQGLAEGEHTLTAKATDAAGNISDVSVSVTLIVDITAPTSPALSSPVDGSIMNQNELILEGTAEAESSVTLLDGGVILGTTAASINGAFSYTTPTLADGNHSFAATATDAAGNVSEVSPAIIVTVDTGRPEPPAFPLPVDGTITNQSVLNLAGTAEVGNMVTLLDNGVILDTIATDVDGSFSYTTLPLADGIHNFTATATDAAGNISNTSATTVTVDTEKPVSPVFSSPADGSITNQNVLTLEGTAEAGSEVTLFNNGEILGAKVADTNGFFSYSTPNLIARVHSFTATATDAAGNISNPSVAITVTVDDSKPAPPMFLLPAGGTVTNQNVVAFKGEAEAWSTITLFDDGEILGTTVTNAEGNFSYTTRALADRIHGFTATAIDVAGNVSDASPTTTVTVDTSPPTVSVSLDKQEYTTNENIQIQYAATDNLDDTPGVEIITDPSLTVNADNQILLPLPVGNLTVTITATDNANNSAIASVSAVINALPAGLDVTPNLLEIHIPKKAKEGKDKDKKTIAFTCYLSLPEGVAISEIDISSLRLNDTQTPGNTTEHDSILEVQFEGDEAFVASLLSLDVTQIGKLDQNANDISVSLTGPVDMTSITLGKLRVTGLLNNQAAFYSEDASRHITLKVSAAPAATRTLLAQNFPNPFNPETWIPYVLASDAHVTIKIFDVRGNLVRRLDLGYQETGLYMEHSDAAHWNGRDSFGQKVASGLYFYTLQAEGFMATRKMVIMK